MKPTGEVTHRGVDIHKGSLGQALPAELFQESLGHRHEPFLRPV
jgi:hypothetical protein